MRIAVLAPSRPTGRRVARDLGERNDVSQVVLIDESQAAEKLAIQLGQEKFAAVPRSTPTNLAEAFSGCAVAVGCSPWDIEEEEEFASAAVEAGVHYVSYCRHPEVLQRMRALDEPAKARAVLILPGLGWTPGITSLLAKAGAAALDEASEIRICWSASAGGPAGLEAVIAALQTLSENISLFETGSWKPQLPSMAGEVYFPEPVGWRVVQLCAGAEAFSLPRSVAGVKKVMVKGGVAEEIVNRSVRALSALPGWAKGDRPVELSGQSLAGLARLVGSINGWSAARVDIVGNSGGSRRAITYGVVDQFPNLVCYPLVVGALMIGRGEISNAGVLSPEEAIDHKSFFAQLAERGIRVAKLER
jgi:saccharopine dehydrogenase-like NADP-dependent oxidoreductase